MSTVCFSENRRHYSIKNGIINKEKERAMTETLLEAKSISKKYEDEYVLQNTDLKIDQGQFVAI